MAEHLRLATESIAGQRPYQEDAVLTRELGDGRTLVAVADGMGGHAAGEVASALALETLVEALEDGMSLDAAFTLANERVHEKSREPGKQGMGTTLVAVVVEGSEYSVANVGDSRCYLVSDAGIRQLTEDHSFVTEALKRGQTEEEAMASQWRDALTRSIGIDEEVKVDVFGPFPVEDGTALLLCSDGLYKVMSNQHIRQLYGLSGGPRGAAQALVAQAFEDGSDDNISVAIAEFGDMPREAPAGTMPMEYEPPADMTTKSDEPEEAPAPAEAGEESPTEEPAAAAPAVGGAPAESGSMGGPPPVVVVTVVLIAIALLALIVLR